MYPFERCMKVIKGHVRNRNKPEGCIAEETIAEETIEFFSEYHKSMETIGIPPDKHETDENEEGTPLYVIQNTDEIVPYIDKSFAKWLREEVERELAIDKESVLETVLSRLLKFDPRLPSLGFCLLGVLRHSIGLSSAGLSLKDTCKLVLPIWSFASAVVTALLSTLSFLLPILRLDEYKDNGRFWGSKLGCNESDVKPSRKDIKKAKAYLWSEDTMTFAEEKIGKRKLRSG
ncbi:putative transposon, En/Spm-like protein [Tanacetum coccineum]